jgi:ribosome-associated protein
MVTARKPRKRAAPARSKSRKKARPASRPKLPKDVSIALEAALDKKAVDLQLLDLRKATAFTDFFVICTGTNIRQVQAIADGIQEALKKHGNKPAIIEGYNKAEWILLDYFDFIVHIFTPATRDFYSLERLWGDAEKVEISA